MFADLLRTFRAVSMLYTLHVVFMCFDIVVIKQLPYNTYNAYLESTGTLKQKCLDVLAIHQCSVFIYQIIYCKFLIFSVRYS